jgi:predicted nucleic acid-binding protein
VIAFLDASALIYMVEGEAPWVQATQAALQQLAGEAPELALAVSRLSLLECRVAPLRRGDQDCLDRFEALFAQPDLLVVELSASVVELATELRANHGLRTPDALQAACCLQLGPDAVMITGDAGFQRVQALQVSLIACLNAPPVAADEDSSLSSVGLGSRMAALFSDAPLEEPISEWGGVAAAAAPLES